MATARRRCGIIGLFLARALTGSARRGRRLLGNSDRVNVVVEFRTGDIHSVGRSRATVGVIVVAVRVKPGRWNHAPGRRRQGRPSLRVLLLWFASIGILIRIATHRVGGRVVHVAAAADRMSGAGCRGGAAACGLDQARNGRRRRDRKCRGIKGTGGLLQTAAAAAIGSSVLVVAMVHVLLLLRTVNDANGRKQQRLLLLGGINGVARMELSGGEFFIVVACGPRQAATAVVVVAVHGIVLCVVGVARTANGLLGRLVIIIIMMIV